MARRQCGAFDLLELRGIGGMAEIYTACPRDSTDPGDIFALKWAMPDVMADANLANSLIDESRIARSLEHRHICRVYGYGSEEERFYIVMEWINGKNLRDIYARTLEMGETISHWMVAFVMSKIALALDYAHRRTNAHGEPLNIVHRDINPLNIMVTYTGTPKLIDFGIALAAGRMVETQVGVVKGKSSYMSPEQARGLDVDGRTDLYAVGILLYEMTTGRLPFSGRTDLEMMESVASASYKPPRSINPTIQAELARIMRKAMEVNPRKRYQCGQDFADDLSAYVESVNGHTTEANLASMMDWMFHTERLHDEARILRLLRNP